MTRQCLKKMIERERGAVINVCPSGALTGPRPLLTGYSATMVRCMYLSCVQEVGVLVCMCMFVGASACMHVSNHWDLMPMCGILSVLKIFCISCTAVSACILRTQLSCLSSPFCCITVHTCNGILVWSSVVLQKHPVHMQ